MDATMNTSKSSKMCIKIHIYIADIRSNLCTGITQPHNYSPIQTVAKMTRKQYLLLIKLIISGRHTTKLPINTKFQLLRCDKAKEWERRCSI